MNIRLVPHPASFPADPPPDPDSAVAVAAHDWRAFDEVTSMVNHWDRPSWRQGMRAVYWLLTFSTPLLVDHVRQCQEAIRHLGFDAIGLRSLHLTLGRIGVADALSRSQLTNLAAEVRRGPPTSLPPGFPLSAIPMTASRGAVRYSVAPWTPVITLHDRLARGSTTIGLPPIGSSGYLRPQLGIAYCNRSLPAYEVRAAVEPLRLFPSVPLLVDRVQMVEMWRVEVGVPLAGPRGDTPAHWLNATEPRKLENLSHTPVGTATYFRAMGRGKTSLLPDAHADEVIARLQHVQ